MMKRLLEEEDVEEQRWKVLPALDVGGGFRLMEHVGKGLWKERNVGFRNRSALMTIANHRNKEGYITPATEEEKVDKARFSVMERVRLITKVVK